MKKLRNIISLLILLGITLSLFACQPEAPVQVDTEKQKEPVKEEELVTKPTSLTIYAGIQEEHALLAVQEFEKASGIKTTFERMSGGEILERIRTERESPNASVWYGGPADTFIAAKGEGLFTPYIPDISAEIPDQYKCPEGYWHGFYIGYLGFVCDGRFFEERNIPIPQTWEDLLMPELKGHIMMANPGSSGTAYTMLATIVQLMGEEDALEYMKKLHEQISRYTTSGSAPGQSAGMGECAVGIVFLHDGIKLIKDGFTNIVLSAPQDGTGYEIGAIGIINNAPEMEAAKIFVEWALSSEAQELAQQAGFYQFLTNVRAKDPEEAQILTATTLIEYDFTWAGNNRDRLIEAWNAAINN